MIRMYEFRKLNVSKDGILDDKLRSIQAQVPYKRWQQIQERNEILQRKSNYEQIDYYMNNDQTCIVTEDRCVIAFGRIQWPWGHPTS